MVIKIGVLLIVLLSHRPTLGAVTVITKNEQTDLPKDTSQNVSVTNIPDITMNVSSSVGAEELTTIVTTISSATEEGNLSSTTSAGSSVHTAALQTITLEADDSPTPTTYRHHTKLDSTIIGTLIVVAVIVTIIVVLVVALIYMMHLWRTNMIQSANHPSVLYSMLKQNENDPEDQLGEILVSIGLASEEDIRPPSPAGSDDSASSPHGLSPPAGRNKSLPGCNSIIDSGLWMDPLQTKPWNPDNLSMVPLDDEDFMKREDSDEELLE